MQTDKKRQLHNLAQLVLPETKTNPSVKTKEVFFANTEMLT